ncbi:MAG TPA: phospholipase D-like domain-containing protein [Geminicoccus sp.]|jgi:phosphatidylserine/phosphatidylglycerophosphate/cardiolipin synthase-like enzyme|uniref:phospholipase D-like domain-containing protein n=1 Tax=Geminicoccus sp. TaxID=2024832 RepID=UPI002E38237E|nr:phospholipase D-like domain-containing protein [Geminicoccus sp.]HEX2529005.1 phospholipase D-like domain-containing protein [Geminicoccus sp.]
MTVEGSFAGFAKASPQQNVERDQAHRIVRPGRNCWRVAKATRATLLPDAASYFARLEQTLHRAEHSILIVGWDFDGRIPLCPEGQVCQPLGPMLRSLVEEKPNLRIHILVWSFAVVHAPSSPAQLLVGAEWQDHPRITVRLDQEHPIYAAHHQKIICVDDRVAFAGGIDLTVKRWDTWRHKHNDRRRTDPDGNLYEPVHDMQMIVEGDAATVVADVAKMRWKVATGEDLPAVSAVRDLWPEGLEAHFRDTDVAVARTLPVWRNQPPVHEIGRLTLDAIAAARQCIYVEAQYFANFEVAERLAESLMQPEGPEVVVLMTHVLPAKLEQFIMGRNRDRVLRRLHRADRYGRFGAFYPTTPSDQGAREILIHAKLMIVDDTFLRVGSANINNRSVGLDTECDLAIEAVDEQQRTSIATIRRQLLSAHLHVTPTELAEAVSRHGSTIAAIRALQQEGKGLNAFPPIDLHGPVRPVVWTSILDPKRPLSETWQRFLRKKNRQARLAISS